MTASQFVTVTELARRTGESPARVRYAILSKRISPTSRIGPTLLYSLHDGEQIVAELKRLNDKGRAPQPAALA
jgi:hypothetical protein